MNRKSLIISTLLSTIAGGAAALVICLVYFTYFYKPVQTAQPPQTVEIPQPTPTRKEPDFPRTSSPPIKESEVISITLSTSYKGFFDENTKCGKSGDENKNKNSDSSSPCRIDLTFNRDGSAEKSIEMRDGQATGNSVWKSKITGEQFKELAESVVNHNVVKSWRDGTMITVSNFSVTIKHTNGIRQPLTNLDGRITGFSSLMDIFKQFERKISWKKIQ